MRSAQMRADRFNLPDQVGRNRRVVLDLMAHCLKRLVNEVRDLLAFGQRIMSGIVCMLLQLKQRWLAIVACRSVAHAHSLIARMSAKGSEDGLGDGLDRKLFSGFRSGFGHSELSPDCAV